VAKPLGRLAPIPRKWTPKLSASPVGGSAQPGEADGIAISSNAVSGEFERFRHFYGSATTRPCGLFRQNFRLDDVDDRLAHGLSAARGVPSTCARVRGQIALLEPGPSLVAQGR
jgi:hypothetical protein